MGLKLIKDNGVVRKAWYAQYKVNGKWCVSKLETPMRGSKIPKTLSGTGDVAFEKSRLLAQAEFEALMEQQGRKNCEIYSAQKVIEGITGERLDLEKTAKVVKAVQNSERMRVDCLEHIWRQSNQRARGEVWDKSVSWMFRLFVESIDCTYVYEVTPEMVANFYRKIRSQYAWNTVTRIMRLIGRSFSDLIPNDADNPFRSIKVVPDKNTQRTIHRKPLSEDELKLLFDEASKDPLLYDITVTTACTGMRIGDVCNLKWASIDLIDGFIDVQTRKTGQEVTLPIFPKLREILETQLIKKEDDEYVFPDAAALYRDNYDGLIRKGKILFAKALFEEEAMKDADIVDVDHKDKTPKEVLSLIRNAGYTPSKTEKIIKVYTLYKSGMAYRQIQQEMGCSRGLISGYLHEIEYLTGDSIVKWSKTCAVSAARLLKRTRQERKVGKRAASLYGWHSLRASFVVSAITSGIPIEVVRKIVGHSTVQMTEEYFNPTKRIMAEAFRKKMSGSILSEGSPAQLEAKPNLASLVANMTPAEREQLKALLG